MKKIIFLVSVVCLSAAGFAQQDQHFTMYMQNPFAYNPSIAGTYDHYQIRSNHRFQYMGFKDAPVTNEISFYGPDSKRTMGYGASVYSDITGPISRISANGVYAYNTKITKDIFVSGGLGMGFIQYKVDGTKLTKQDISDPALENRIYSSIVPDASMGVYVWNTEFYGGLSIQHLLHSKINISEINNYNNLNLHYYFVGGYRRDISTGRKRLMWVLEPSVILKKVVPAAWQLEMNAKITYKSMLWGGISYRTQDAVSLVFGYLHQKKVFVGYSYDIITNDIRKYTSGTHEMVLGFNFAPIKKLKITQKKKK